MPDAHHTPRKMPADLRSIDLPEPTPGYRWVRHLLTREWIEELEETPWFLSVSSNAYWES